MTPEEILQLQLALSNPGNIFIIGGIGLSTITTMLYVGGKIIGYVVGKDGSVAPTVWSGTKPPR